MASDKSDIIQVSPEELYDPAQGGFAGAPKVNVYDVEEVKPTEVKKDDSQKVEQSPVEKKQAAPITHETDQVKSTYTQEEPQLSTKSKIKDKFVQLGDKLRPKDAVKAKNADPHPGLM